MTNYTHKKRSYKAVVLEWDGTNTKEVLELLQQNSVLHTTGIHILIYNEHGIDTLPVGGYVVKRENGTTRIYKTKELFDIQYEQLED